jgi:hypothetical protein
MMARTSPLRRAGTGSTARWIVCWDKGYSPEE